jgi:hypothetical protein
MQRLGVSGAVRHTSLGGKGLVGTTILLNVLNALNVQTGTNTCRISSKQQKLQQEVFRQLQLASTMNGQMSYIHVSLSLSHVPQTSICHLPADKITLGRFRTSMRNSRDRNPYATDRLTWLRIITSYVAPWHGTGDCHCYPHLYTQSNSISCVFSKASINYIVLIVGGGHAVAQWVRHCATRTGTSRDRFPMMSLEFFIILPTALWPCGRLSL